jgi:hypothetical protein
MTDDFNVRQRMISNGGNADDRRLARAMEHLKVAMMTVAIDDRLALNEVMALVPAVLAQIAEKFGNRAEMSEIYRQWAELLASEAPLVYRADGNA